MTIASLYEPDTYAGNGSLDTFAITFPFLSDGSNIKVSIKVDSTGVITEKTAATHYNVSGSNVVFTVGNVPASGQTVIVELDLDYLQSSDYVENAALPAETLEDDLDKRALVEQLNKDLINRSLKMDSSIDVTTVDTVIATDTLTAGHILRVNTDADGFDWASPVEAALTSDLTPTDGGFVVGDGTDFVVETGAIARASMGVAIGTDVQAYDAGLADIAALAVTDGNIIVGDGTHWVAESEATARTSLGLGTGNTPQFTGIEVGHASDTTVTRAGAGDIAVEGNAVYRAGGTDVPITDGGTGSSSAADARTALGLAIGTDVQAYDAELAALAGLTSAADKVPYFTGSGTAAVADFTAAGRALVDDASAAAQRTTLGVGTGDSPSFTGVTATASVTVGGNATAAGYIDILEDSDNGAHKVRIQAPASLAADYTLTLPADDGDVNQFLQTDGSGTLTWASGAGGGIANVVEDVTPQLGGDLDANGFDIAFDTGTGILDENGNEQLLFTTTASATGYLTITNSTATAGPAITVVDSGQANSGIQLLPKGTKCVLVQPVGTGDQGLQIQNGTTHANPSGKLILDTGDMTASRVVTLQDVAGTMALYADIPLVATQAQQETGTANTAWVSPGRQHYHPSAAKAWLQWDMAPSGGAPAIAVSYNVTSLTDTATGRQGVNFTTSFSTAKYVALGTGGQKISNGGGTLTSQVCVDDNAITPNSGACPLITEHTSLVDFDVEWMSAAFYGDQ